MKKRLRKIKKAIVASGPKSGLWKQVLVSAYIFGLKMFTRYGRLERSIYRVIGTYRPELEGNAKETRKLYREIMYCRFMYGILPKEYFIYRFDLLSQEGRMTFVTRSNK